MQKKIIDILKSVFSRTPLHPQWLIFRDNYQGFSSLDDQIKGRVLDIGCGRGEVRKYLDPSIDYIGLDYYFTSVNWYMSAPDLYADAMNIPLKNCSIDTVLLLDVLEHLPDTDKCLMEIARVLKDNGKFLVQVPLIYPIHDAPLDFYRWTEHGLKTVLDKNGFRIVSIFRQGNPFDTSILLFNLALGRILLNCIKERNPLIILIPLYPLIVLVSNMLAVIGTLISPKEDFMPWGYRIVAEKK